ncbi:RrF2 family transcriptional regulator [Candidatus Aerophobetes bacterium]|nr:RrF2 family transcriptional regulator [Candidatus Aerophobetes bacterium]
MKISTKTRYGVRAMFELAKNYGSYPVSVKTIAQRQEIPLSYLEQILNHLHKAKLVRSVRGPGGGFLLAKRPEHIRIIDITHALEESIKPVFCVDEMAEEDQCKRMDGCVARLLWKKLDEKIKEVLEGTTLKDLCEWAKKFSSTVEHEFIFHI